MSKVERSQDLNQSLIDKVRSGKSPTPKDRRDRFSYRFNKSSEDAKIRIQKDILDSLKESDGIPPLVYPQDYIFDIAHFRANGNLGELIDDMSNIANPEEKFEMVKSENRILRERLHNALQREMKAIKTFQKLANDNRLLLLKLKECENIHKGKSQCGCCTVVNGSVYSPAPNSNGHLRKHNRITLDGVKAKPMANKSTTTCDLHVGENVQDESTSTDDLLREDLLTQQALHILGNEANDVVASGEPVATIPLSLAQRRELFKTKSSPDILADFNVVNSIDLQGRSRSSSLGCQGSKEEKTDAVQMQKSASISGAINGHVSVSNVLPFRKLGEKRVRSFPSCLDVVDEETDVREHNSHTKDRSSLSSEGNFSLTHSISSDLVNSPCHTPSPESVFSERMSFPPHVSPRHMHSRSLPAQLNRRQLQANVNIEGTSNDEPKQSLLEVSKPRRQTADSITISTRTSAALSSAESTRSLPADILKRGDIKKKVDKASSSDDSDKEEKPLTLRLGRRGGYIENDPNDFASDIRKFQKMLNTGQLPTPSHESDNEEDIIQACEAVRNQRYSRRRGSAVVQIPASSVQMDLHVATEEPLEVRKKQYGSVLSLADDKRGSRWSSILKNRRKLLLQKDSRLRISEDLKEYLSTKTRPTHIDSETELSLYRDTHWTHLMTITDETGHSRPLSEADSRCLPDTEMKRREAVWELFHSEVVYLTAHLLVLKECFLEPLREIQEKGFLINIDDKKIFSNLEDLCEVSAKFAKDLLHLFKNEQDNQFGSTASVVTAFTKFKCAVHPQYEHYCLSYISTLNYLETLKPMEDVQELFKWCETDPRCKRLKLTDLLVAPFQHLTKYPLLLKNIRKRTSEGDRQHAPLTSTIKSVEVLIQELEGNVTVVRNFQKLKELQKNLVWPSVGELDPKSYIPENKDIHDHYTRRHSNLYLPRAKTNKGKQKPTYQASVDFNNLELEHKNSSTLSYFKTILKRRCIHKV